jgi:hypothetical protein
VKKFQHYLAVLVLVGGTGLLGGCATLVSGDETDTQITTDPIGAECELTGDNYNTFVTTPANVQLDSDVAPLTIVCNADGHVEERAEIDTSMDGSIFGNILMGGLIGIAIDAASGSGQKFPETVDLVLVPTSFPSIAARDAWYERQVQRVEDKYVLLADEMPSYCAQTEAGTAGQANRNCDAETAEKIAPLKAAELEELARIKLETPIEG